MASETVTLEQQKLILDAIQSIGGTIINIKRYPAGSTIVKMALERGITNFNQLLKDLDSFTLSENERQLLLNDTLLPDKFQQLAYVSRFVQTLAARGVRSLTFHRGLSDEELQAFIELLGQTPEELKRQGPIPASLQERNIVHITVDEKVFVALTKDQVVAEIAELERAKERGDLSPENFQDSTFVKFMVSKLEHGASDLSKGKIAELKRSMGYDDLEHAQQVDYDRIAPVLTQMLEKFNEEGAEEVVTESESARPEAPGADLAGSLSPELAESVARQEKKVRDEVISAAQQEQIDKLTQTFKTISQSIFGFKQPTMRAKLVGDFLKIITNFKTQTLSQMLSTRLADNGEQDAELKDQILTTMTARKRSAVIDMLMEKYQRLIDGLAPTDFEVSDQVLDQSQTLLKRLMDVIRKTHPSQELEQKTARAMNLVAGLRKEAPNPEKLLILKVRRLLTREPVFFVQEEIQAHLPDLVIRLMDINRPDVAKKILEKLFINSTNEDPDIRIQVAGALVRISQGMLDVKNTSLHPTLYGLLLRGFRKETEQRIYAAYLAAMISDLGRLITEGYFLLVVQIFKTIRMVITSEQDPVKKKFLDMAEDKVSSHQELLDYLVKTFSSEDQKQADQALQILNAMDENRVAPVMIDLLKNSLEMRVRKKSMSVLTNMPEAAKPLIREAINADEQPWYFLRNLLIIIGDLKDTACQNAAAKLLDHEYENVRKAALQAMIKFGTTTSDGLLAMQLPKLDNAGKHMVINRLGAARYKDGLSYMIGLWTPNLPDRDEPLALDLIAALGKIGDPEVLTLFRKILKPGFFKARADDTVTAAVMRALGDIGGEEAKALAGKFVKNNNSEVAKAAQQAIQKIG